jgi:S-layer homology domain
MAARSKTARIRLALAGGALVIACAQTTRASPSDASAAEFTGSDVGTGWNILSIAAAGFTLNSGTGITINALGYRISPAATFETPVTLPSGAGIGYLGLFAYDTDPAFGVQATLLRYVGFGTLPLCSVNCGARAPAVEQITSVQSVGSSGYQYVPSNLLSPLHTVNNNVVNNGSLGGQYVVRVTLDQQLSSGQQGFRGVDLWWKRQISPGPSVATFLDVPTNHPFFREIEALAASGITLGCTATTFCPDAALTRAQVAAFLARALGLYWQY